jgi:hypothetical protein
MGKPALKDRMPRYSHDHRGTADREIRTVFDELGARFPLRDGIARDVALITAIAAHDYRQLTAQVLTLEQDGVRRPAKEKAALLNRLRRRRDKAGNQYLAGVKMLEAFGSNGHRPPALGELIAAQRERQA